MTNLLPFRRSCRCCARHTNSTRRGYCNACRQAIDRLLASHDRVTILGIARAADLAAQRARHAARERPIGYRPSRPPHGSPPLTREP